MNSSMTVTVIIVILVFWMECLGFPVTQQLSSFTTAALVAWTRSVLSSSCVILVPLGQSHVELHAGAELKEIWRHINSFNAMISVSYKSSFNSTQQVNSCKGAAIFMILVAEKYNFQDLEQLLTKESKNEEIFARARWLLLLPSLNGSEKEEFFLRNVYVPFDSQVLIAETDSSSQSLEANSSEARTTAKMTAEDIDKMTSKATVVRASQKVMENKGVLLTEVYREGLKCPLRLSRWGRWPGLPTPAPLAHRRRNLHGKRIRAAVVDDPPLIEVETDVFGTVTRVGGFFPLIWSYLVEVLNITTEWVVPPDGAFGANTSRGWNGMIRMVLDGKADLSPSPFMMTSLRSKVIRYSVPWASTRASVFIKTPAEAPTDWEIFVLPFRRSLWLTLAAAMFVLAVTLWATHRAAPFYFADNKNGAMSINYTNSTDSTVAYPLKNCLFYIWGTFCSQGHDETPAPLGSRVVYLTSYLVSILVMAAYTGLFIAGLATPNFSMPFEDLEGFLRDRSYSFSVIAKSGLFTQFQNAHDATMRRIFEEFLSPHSEDLPTNDNAAVEELCKRKVAFMGNADITQKYALCALSPLALESFPLNNAMVMPRRCPYAFAFNAALQSMRRSGVLRMQYQKLWSRTKPETPPTFLHVHLNDIIPLIGLLAVGSALALGLSVLEYLLFHLQRCRHFGYSMPQMCPQKTDIVQGRGPPVFVGTLFTRDPFGVARFGVTRG